jgi:hypothetical protein
MKRHTLNNLIQVRLSDKYFNLINKYADDREINPTEVVRRCVENFFEKEHF